MERCTHVKIKVYEAGAVINMHIYGLAFMVALTASSKIKGA